MCHVNDQGIGPGADENLKQDDKLKKCLRQTKIP